MRRSTRIIVAVALAGAIAALPAIAQARISSSTSAATTIASATMTQVSSPTLGKPSCAPLGLHDDTVGVSWTATPDAYATGYNITVTKAGGSSTTTSVTGRTTTTTTVSFTSFVNYTITVSATYRNWDSRASSAATVYCGLF